MKSSRNTATRKQAERTPNYNPKESESELDLPHEIVESFTNQGYSLRWIRVLLSGGEDMKNIGKRLRMGFTFVTFDELPDEYKNFYTHARLSRIENEVVAIGDVALAKIPTKIVLANRRKAEQKAVDQEAAVNRRLLTEGSPRVRQLMPIFNESTSRSQVIKGTRQRDFGATARQNETDDGFPEGEEV